MSIFCRVVLLSWLAGAAVMAQRPSLPAPRAPVPKIILDVDLAEDVDDAGALAVLHALAQRGEAEVLGVLVSSKNEWVGPCADAINTWYGRPDLPIGYQRGHQYGYRNAQDPDRDTSSKYAEAVARAFPRDLPRSSEAPDAARLCRQLLASQPDRSVTFVTVGFLTNLRDLLDSRPDEHSPLDGEALVQRKVKEWVCMGGIFPGGRFPGGQGEYNVMWDTAASVRAINDWPTPIVFSGFEIGARIKVGARLRETPEANPVRACYRLYNGLTDREAWDLTAVLYAVRGARDYWKLSEPGLCLMHARVSHGYNEWIPTPQKSHRYLLEALPPQQVGQVLEELLIEPPRAGNPVFPGWYADPEVAVFGDRYWIYPTFSAPFDEQLHFDAFSSPDLIHWTKHERILEQRAVSWARRAMWAPAAVERRGKYYLFFSANDVHEGEVGGIGVAVADRPEGPFRDLLGRPLVNEIVHGAQPIDQFVFRDDDGQEYLVYGGWSHCNLARLKPDFTGLLPFPDGRMFKEITPKGYVEGPMMFRKNGRCYFMWSEGGWTGPDYSVAYAIADSPLGPFERLGKVLQQDPSVATGAGHHSVLHVPGSDDWYIVYHRRPLGERDANHRVTCIDRMEFDEQGRIQPVQITRQGVARRPLAPESRFQLPRSDDGLPGAGPLRRYDWFQQLWVQRRTQWSEDLARDRHAVVFLGDSITQGWGDALSASFPGLKAANRGISGDTTRGVLIRLEEDVLALDPAAVVLLIGTNDLEERAAPETIAANLQLILARLKAHPSRPPVVLCLVFPSAASMRRPADAIRRINALYAQAVRGDPQVLLLDTWTLFATPAGDANPAEFPDLLHLNAAGYAKWAAALRPVLATLGLLETAPDDFVPEPGFTNLFNGRDLTGWGYRVTSEADRKAAEGWRRSDPQAPPWPVVAQPVAFDGQTVTDDGRYLAKNGRLIVTFPPEGRKIQQLWTRAEFNDDFVLKLEFRATPNADSGVFLRGRQLQCRDYALAGPYEKLERYRPQDWNELVITVTGRTARCTCNGEVLEEAFEIPATGPLGLEGDRGQIEYRRIRLRSDNALRTSP